MEAQKIEHSDEAKWYTVSTYSGYEKKVASQILLRVKANNLEEEVLEALVPVKNSIVVNQGKKKTVEEKLYPGYVLVKMEMNNRTWQIVRNTEGVTGFVGTERKPTPLSEKEVKGIMALMKVKEAGYQVSLAVDDAVKIVDGPWKDFVGTVSELNDDKGQVKVLISVFGRETPVVLDYLQVIHL